MGQPDVEHLIGQLIYLAGNDEWHDVCIGRGTDGDWTVTVEVFGNEIRATSFSSITDALTHVWEVGIDTLRERYESTLPSPDDVAGVLG